MPTPIRDSGFRAGSSGSTRITRSSQPLEGLLKRRETVMGERPISAVGHTRVEGPRVAKPEVLKPAWCDFPGQIESRLNQLADLESAQRLIAAYVECARGVHPDQPADRRAGIRHE